MLPPPGYRDLELVGRGATSRVFRATSARTGQVIALKRLHRQLLDSNDALSRLRREFSALTRLHHPSIVATYDVIRWEGDPTVVMDFIEGVGLDEAIAKEGPLHFDRVRAIAGALLDALIAAHGAGIVHRDVKPQNVRLGEDGQVYLLDFGSARFDAASELTKTGTTVGTPDYMAPELFAGSVYDPRVDLYGVGATLYECVTGEVPQSATSLTELAFKRTHVDVPTVRALRPETPEGLVQLIDRALARSPDDRFASAALARWTLDNPDPALAFARRRKAHPPCLHCDARIDAHSESCPACGSDHPFSYAPGSSHVVLKGVRDPAALMGAVATRFPERDTKAHDAAFAERIAALEDGPQRMLSFVDRDEACRLADELETAGAQCEVIDDAGTSGWRLYAWCTVAFVAGVMFIGSTVLGAEIGLHHALFLVLPTLAALMGERVLSVVRSLQGVLTESRYPVNALEGARARYGAAAGLFGGASLLLPAAESALAATAAPASLVAAIPLLELPLLASAFGTASLAIASWFLRLRRPPKTKSGSPEPSALDKLKRAFALPRSVRDRLKPEVAVVLAATGLALVPIELMSLDVVRAATVSALSAAPGAVAPTPGGGMSELPIAPTAPAPVEPVAPGPIEPSPVEPAMPTAPATPPSRGPIPLITSGLLLWLGALLAFRMGRRHRRIVEDGRTILDQVKNAQLASGERTQRLPARRRRRLAERIAGEAPAESVAIADRIAMTDAPDAFLLAARRRAADLAHVLPDDASSRLERALESLGRRLEPQALEDAYLARCIRETDAEHRLRFELLALEGRMESEAAEAWFRAIEEAED